jgi:hypothetical protein
MYPSIECHQTLVGGSARNRILRRLQRCLTWLIAGCNEDRRFQDSHPLRDTLHHTVECNALAKRHHMFKALPSTVLTVSKWSSGTGRSLRGSRTGDDVHHHSGQKQSNTPFQYSFCPLSPDRYACDTSYAVLLAHKKAGRL